MKTAQKIMRSKAYVKAEMDRCLPEERSDALWRSATDMLASLLERHAALPKGVRVHTDTFIFPAAAVYLTVKDGPGEAEAWRIMEKAVTGKAEETGRKLAKLLRFPGMKGLFIRLWDPVTRRRYGTACGFRNVFYPKRKGEFRMDVTDCPYIRFFSELGCPELTKLSCAADDCVYGSLPGIVFERTGTLGTGAERCDFRIRKE